ncbi:MAG: acyl-CoA dehydrogenase domain-containing protein [Vampirovibrionia bacterium]
MYGRLFNYVKSIVPRISNTELIALRSGTTSVDRMIFEGKVTIPHLKTWESNKEKQYLMSNVNNVIKKYRNVEQVYPNPNIKEILSTMAQNRFFSFIIDEKYGGTKFSVSGLSNVVMKLTSANPALGIITMVPNSLGPSELLENYGTETQRQKYLPRLASGKDIPCFGLTGPNNGSDAAGAMDQGEVIIQGGKKYIKVSVNKRYITLAPIADLVGLAVKVNDPNNLLNEGSEGVTVALLEKDHPGLRLETHHNPLNVGFPNGTVKGDLLIPIDDVIGGEKNVGEGWKMLMECLAAGRAVCLPATANASSKAATFGIWNYARHRRQFKIPLIKMEGVQNKLADMVFHTWLIQCSVKLTNALLDAGEKPAVISAIMKEQTTERAREVLNHGMDIHAGSAICLGENNFLEKFYRSAPVGITVEGSNTLTKSLIIFGQGLNKSHPHIFDVYKSILDDDVKGFKTHFNKLFGHSLRQFVMLPNSGGYSGAIERQTRYFANLANFVALMGGAIKRDQFISGDMAQLMSNLYLAHSVIWCEEREPTSKILYEYCLNRICDENQEIINRIISNYPSAAVRILLRPMRASVSSDVYQKKRDLVKEVDSNHKIMERIKENIYSEEGVLEELDRLNSLDQDSKEYATLYNKVIQVGEYENNP